MAEAKPTVTLTLDVTLAQIVLLALRNAEDRELGECRFDRFEPDLATRQAFMKAYHQGVRVKRTNSASDLHIFPPLSFQGKGCRIVCALRRVVVFLLQA